MTGDELRVWQLRCGLRTDAEAAAALGIGISTYRRKRTGRSTIRRDTELLTEYYEVFSRNAVEIAVAALRIAHLSKLPIAPVAAAKVAEMVSKVVIQNGNRR